MDKFQRNYRLIIRKKNGDTITIEPPFTLEADIIRKNFYSNNTASFRIYNLSENTRSQLQKNQADMRESHVVTLMAGYGDNLSMIFVGDITMGNSVRNGNSWVTSVECLDSGYALSATQISRRYSAGTSYRDIVIDIIKQLPNVSLGAIGDIAGTVKRETPISGNAGQLINEITGNSLFLDNGRAYVLGDNEAVEHNPITIDSSAGLLGTPRREYTFIMFDMIFEPRLFIGQKMTLLSSGNSQYNDAYRVDSITHRLTISEATNGTAITTVGCVYGEAFAGIRMEFQK